jgi:outer membrane receptor protein involved in Fe transport
VRDAIGMQSYGNKTEDLFLQFAMSGDLLEMNAGPLSYAFVAEYEDESLKFIPDELIQQAPPTTDSLGGPITGLTGSGWYRLTGYDGEGDRQRWSLGGEIRIPLHPTLTVNLAARWDDYDSGSTSFGGDITPSASIEWRPLDNLLLRAGYTESFRAPDMAQVFVRTGFFTGATDFISCYEQYVFINGTDEGFNVGDCDGTTIFARRVGAQEFGGDPLDAETGDNLWLGFSWDITENFNLTVDYTKLRLENRVLQQSTQGLLDDEYACFTGQSPQNTPCDLVEQQIRRKVDPTTGISFIDEFFVTSINQFEEEGEYLDVRLIYNLNTKYGGFRFQGDYNNVLSHTQRLTSDSEESNLKSDPFVGGWDFRSSFIGSVTWSYRDFTTTVTGVYRGATTIWRPVSNPVGSITGENYIETENWWIDPYITWNWTASYNFTDDLLARVRVVNVFDEEPPFDDTFLAFDNPWYNIYVYPGAAIGRFAALEMEFTF